MKIKTFISTTAAAKKLGVSRITIFNMIQDGRIEAMRVGRNYIIPDDFQQAFVKDFKKAILPILKKHQVIRASIFGSTARNQRGKKSDLDILVEMKKGKNLFDLVALKHALEDKIKTNVDVITYDGVRPKLQSYVFNEQVTIL